MKIMLLASGSGGHVYPAAAFAEYLIAQGIDVVMGVIEKGFENRLPLNPKIQKIVYRIEGKTKHYAKRPYRLVSLVRELRKKHRHVKNINCIVAFGGFMSFIAVIARHQLKCPLFLHEQNATLGDGNNFAVKYAKKVMCVYETTNAKESYKTKLIRTGNPRSSEANKYFHRNLMKPYRILFFAGSLGSQTMMQVLEKTIDDIKDDDMEIHVITGAKLYEHFSSKKSRENVFYYGYVSELLQLMSKMNFMVMRAGATSISEMITLEVPSLLIPSPYVKHDHQMENAKYLEKLGATMVIAEKEITPEKIKNIIYDLKSDYEKQYKMREAMRKLKKTDASMAMLKVITNELKL